MKNCKLIFIACLLCITQNAHSQDVTEKKWSHGVFAGGCFNVMTTGALTVNNNNNAPNINGRTVATNPLGTDRVWKYEYQAGFTFGGYAKRLISDNFSLQAEINVLLSRQNATLEDNPIDGVALGQTLLFSYLVATKGTTTLNNLYLQIPFLMNISLDKSTVLDAGLFVTNSMVNNSTQDMTVSTLTEFNAQTGVVKTLDKPKVVKKTEKPTMTMSMGWILGVHYAINDKFGVRLRYEGGMTSFSEFSDLRENRMSVSLSYKID
jgi:hypothetical protein